MNNNILKLEIRQKIYNLISKNPGLHLRELSRRIDIPFATLRYHIHFLKKHNLISEKNNSHYTRYYIVNKISVKDKKILSLLRNKTIRGILFIIYGQIVVSRTDISKFLDIPPTTVAYYLKKIQELDLITQADNCKDGIITLSGAVVERKPKKREIFYRFTDLDLIWDILFVYQNSFKDDFTKEMLWFLDFGDNTLPKKYPSTDYDSALDKAIKIALDFFPLPFCA